MPDHWLQDRLEELKASMVFCTRLPLFRTAVIGSGTLAKAAWAFPIAGVLVGLIAAAVYGLAHRIGIAGSENSDPNSSGNSGTTDRGRRR